MKAVIMAGGEGTRLRPLTCGIPKPMVPVAGRPVMEHIFGLLAYHGITETAVTLQYLPDAVTERFGDGSGMGARIEYFTEKTPLGTAGSVLNARSFLDGTFAVISGDALTDIDIAQAAEFHRAKGAVATLILKSVPVPLEYGVVITGPDGRVERFVEKPGWSEVFSDTVNTGIYILSPAIFDYIDAGKACDFSKDVFPRLLAAGAGIYGYTADGYWCDIGDVAAYLQAQYDAAYRICRTEPAPGLRDLGGGVMAGRNAVIDREADVRGPCVIGPGSRVGAGAFIGPGTVVGSDCVIGAGSRLKRCVIWDRVNIGERVSVSGAVVCDGSVIRDNASVFEQAVIGSGSVIGSGAQVKPSVKIWPGKQLEEGAVANENVVWGSTYVRSIFGARGVSGEANVSITPEFAAALGAAFASCAGPRKPYLTISGDADAAAGMIRQAFGSGMTSAGARVADLGELPLPAARTAVRFHGADGGAHIYAGSPDGRGPAGTVTLDLLNANGFNVDRPAERKIETALARCDFPRAAAPDITKHEKMGGFADFYKRAILNRFKGRPAGMRIAVNTTDAALAALIGSILAEMGCETEFSDMKYLGSKASAEGTGRISAEMFASRVSMGGFAFGAAVGRDGEDLLLADSRGRLVTEEMFDVLAASMLLGRENTLALAGTAPGAVERMAEQRSAKTTRVKSLARDIMPALGHDQFLLYFDAVAAIAALTDHLRSTGATLADIVDRMPEMHIVRREISCSSNDKGRIMRSLSAEPRKGPQSGPPEGVKLFYEGGWVLVLPDAGRPVVRVVAEGADAETASELAGDALSKIAKTLEKRP